jgi:hypothetical protein
LEVGGGVADWMSFDALAQAVEEGVVDGRFDDGAGAGGALLAAEAEGAGDDAVDGGVEVASAQTMMESLPPISRMVRLIQIWPGWVLAARSWMSRPTSWSR